MRVKCGRNAGKKKRSRPWAAVFDYTFPSANTKMTLEPDGQATGCNPVEVGSIPTGVSALGAAHAVSGTHGDTAYFVRGSENAS
jgi:hypothetical protein